MYLKIWLKCSTKIDLLSLKVAKIILARADSALASLLFPDGTILSTLFCDFSFNSQAFRFVVK